MTIQEANALVDDFSFVYKEKSTSKEELIECREVNHKVLEKRIPEKPIERKIIDVSMYGYKYKYQCPKCLATVSQYTDNYCPNCRQALDWSENNG